MIVEQLLAEVHVVGQLPVEGEAEPLVLLDVVALERLGVAAIVLAAGGIADVPDGRPAGVLLHQVFVLAAMVQSKDLADVPHFLVGVDQLVAIGIVGGHAGGQLAAILDVQEHPRHEPGDFLGPLLGTQRADAPARQVIDSGDAAFFVEIAHGIVFYDRPLRFTIHLTGGRWRNRSRAGGGPAHFSASRPVFRMGGWPKTWNCPLLARFPYVETPSLISSAGKSRCGSVRAGRPAQADRPSSNPFAPGKPYRPGPPADNSFSNSAGTSRAKSGRNRG